MLFFGEVDVDWLGMNSCCSTLVEFIFPKFIFENIFSWDKELSLGILA
jgi:hypothetical protein